MKAKATVNYHLRSEAEQAFRFDVDGIVGNLIGPELSTADVEVEDLRDGTRTVDFDQDGILFTIVSSQVTDFESDQTWTTQYDDELRALLTDKIGAREVIVFDHTVRIDDPDAARQPARNVHNDYTQASAEQRLIDLVGAERASGFREGRFGFVNVWRPITDVITTSPLGFIRPGSMQPDDWVNIALIYPDRRGQILGVAENQEHEWFYLSEMTPQDVAIFNIYDNRGRPHLAHSALDMESNEKPRAPRKSIESRTLVKYT